MASCSFGFLFVLGFLALALLIIGVYRGKWSAVLSLVRNVECNRSEEEPFKTKMHYMY